MNVVALCDVDDNYLAALAGASQRRGPITISGSCWSRRRSTPLSWRSRTTRTRLPRRPRCAREARLLRKAPHPHRPRGALYRGAAKKQKRVTQMGTQIHAGSNYRRVVELVKSAGSAPSARYTFGAARIGRPTRAPTAAQPVPATLNYDLWVGPAPMRPQQRVSAGDLAALLGPMAMGPWATWRATTPTCLSGAGPAASDESSGRGAPVNPDCCPHWPDRELGVPRPRRAAPGQAHLV